jgi:hypothetical protein
MLIEVPLQPPQRRALVLRRSALRVQLDELQLVFERKVREFSCCVFR